jgi:hypothetical protein
MNKKLIFLFGLLVSGVFARPVTDAQSRAMVLSLAEGEPDESAQDLEVDSSMVLVPYQASRPIAAPAQDPDAVIAAIKKMCAESAKLVEVIDDLVKEQDEKQLVAFEEVESQVADLAGDIEGANQRKDQAADMMALVAATREDSD